jgi:hypothetical protein
MGPASLDFGAVHSRESKTLELLFQNTSAQSRVVTIEFSSASSVFGVSSTWNSVPAGMTRPVQVSFSPVDLGNHTASLIVRRTGCAEKTVGLTGECVVNPNALTWTPLILNFAAVVGSTRVQTVTLFNSGSAPIELSNIAVNEAMTPTVFAVTRFPLRVPAAQTDGAGMIVPGEATIEISYHPTMTGPRAGTLTMNTDLPMQPSISINLRGSSGLP